MRKINTGRKNGKAVARPKSTHLNSAYFLEDYLGAQPKLRLIMSDHSVIECNIDCTVTRNNLRNSAGFTTLLNSADKNFQKEGSSQLVRKINLK